MTFAGIDPWIVFLGVSSLVLLIFLVAGGRRTLLQSRLEELTHRRGSGGQSERVSDGAMATLSTVGKPLMPENEEERSRLRTRLIQAGLYRREALPIFLGVKMLLIIGPALLGV